MRPVVVAYQLRLMPVHDEWIHYHSDADAGSSYLKRLQCGQHVVLQHIRVAWVPQGHCHTYPKEHHRIYIPYLSGHVVHMPETKTPVDTRLLRQADLSTSTPNSRKGLGGTKLRGIITCNNVQCSTL